jgi:hypothetical protein
MQASCFLGNRPWIFFPLNINLNFVTQGRTILFFTCFVLAIFVFRFVTATVASTVSPGPWRRDVLFFVVPEKCYFINYSFLGHLIAIADYSASLL